MAPADTTPHGGEIMHEPPERRFPQPQPGGERDEPLHADSGTPAAGDEPDIAHRPSLPKRPQRVAADIEDEEADPVIDSGPGIADGVKSLKKQRG